MSSKHIEQNLAVLIWEFCRKTNIFSHMYFRHIEIRKDNPSSDTSKFSLTASISDIPEKYRGIRMMTFDDHVCEKEFEYCDRYGMQLDSLEFVAENDSYLACFTGYAVYRGKA